MKHVATFIGGALVGAAIAALLTPERGEDLRYRIKTILMKHGIIPADNVNEFVEMIATEIEDQSDNK